MGNNDVNMIYHRCKPNSCYGYNFLYGKYSTSNLVYRLFVSFNLAARKNHNPIFNLRVRLSCINSKELSCNVLYSWNGNHNVDNVNRKSHVTTLHTAWCGFSTLKGTVILIHFLCGILSLCMWNIDFRNNDFLSKLCI